MSDVAYREASIAALRSLADRIEKGELEIVGWSAERDAISIGEENGGMRYVPSAVTKVTIEHRNRALPKYCGVCGCHEVGSAA